MKLTKCSTKHLQATIQVKFLAYDLTLASVYCLPRHNIKKDAFNNFLQTLGPKFIAGSDYNCKYIVWGSRLNTTKGSELANLLKNITTPHKRALQLIGHGSQLKSRFHGVFHY